MTKIEHNMNLMKILNDAVDYFKKKYLEKRNEFLDGQKNDVKTQTDEFFGTVHIYSHLDADGMSAAAILALAFQKEGIPYHITILKQLEEQYFEDIRKSIIENKNFAIFTDYGSGQLNLFNKYLSDLDFIILDHHELLLNEQNQPYSINGFQANPYNADVNGSKEISGAGMAYLFAINLNPTNKELSYYAIIGAIGDVQNIGPQQSFIGENNVILQTGINENLIVVEIEPILARSKSLSYALAYTLPIEIKEFKGDIRNASQFLNRLKIKQKSDLGDYRTLADLGVSEKKRLTSELVQLSLQQSDVDPTAIDRFIGANYLIKPFEKYKELYDAKDFAKMLNACGRLDEQSIGLAACIVKSDSAIKRAIGIIDKYSAVLKKSLDWLKKGDKIKEHKSIQSFYGGKQIHENIIGVICTTLLGANYVDREKPIIGYADSDEGFYKVSGRCTNSLVEKGVNLSTAIRSVCKELGINEKGGGHPPASGAKIPTNKKNNFLQLLDEKITEQKKKKSTGLGEFGI